MLRKNPMTLDNLAAISTCVIKIDFRRLQQSRAYDLLMRVPLLGWSMFCATLQMAGLARYVREADAALPLVLRNFHISVDGALPRFGRDGRLFFVIEKFNRAAQNQPLVVQHHDLEAPAPSRQDVHSPVRVFTQHFIDQRSAARIHDSFVGSSESLHGPRQAPRAD